MAGWPTTSSCSSEATCWPACARRRPTAAARRRVADPRHRRGRDRQDGPAASPRRGRRRRRPGVVGGLRAAVHAPPARPAGRHGGGAARPTSAPPSDAGAAVHEILPLLLDELGRAPTLVVIEDVHWADEATLDLIALLGRRVRSTRGLVVVSCRDDELGSDHPLLGVLGEPRGGRGRADPAGAAQLGRRARAGRAPLGRRRAAAASARAATRSSSPRCWRPAGRCCRARSAMPSSPGPPPSTPMPARSSKTCRWSPGRRHPSSSSSWVEPARTTSVPACRRACSSRRRPASPSATTWRASPSPTASTRCDASPCTGSPSGCCAGRDADAARLAHHADEAHDADALEEFAPRAAFDAVARGAHREAVAQFRRALRPERRIVGAARADLLEHGAHELYLIDRFDEAIAWLQDAIARRHEAGDVRREANAWRLLSTRAALRRAPAGGGRERLLRRRPARRSATAATSWPRRTPTWR